MNFLQKLSIKTKITLIIISVSLVAIIIGFSIFTFFNINNMKKDLVNQSSLIAKLMAEYSEFALLFDDTKSAVQNLENLKTIPYIISAELYNAEGKFFASYNNKQAVNSKLIIPKSSYKFISDELQIYEPIYSSYNEQIGSIFLRVSLVELNENVNEFIFWMLIIIALVAIIITLMASSFQKIISRPIIALTNLTEEISETRDYSMRIQKKSNDEIGILYDGFNNMLEV
ncbi:MAG: CHASE sensor domain-containing protein, partial [Bacteroidales bacterium]|nr:CHASE sensor domain-containing protein [Bacteroidales bacterium]